MGPSVWSAPADAERVGPEAEAEISSTEPVATLLTRCGKGDLAAFRALYATQAARLYGLALSITSDAGLAADAVQDTFLLVWRQAERFDTGRGTAEAWLAALLRFRAIDILRRRGRERALGAMPERASEEPDALQRLVAASEGHALRACLDALPTDRRILLIRAFVGGRTYAELAAEDGEPLGTVKARIRRALAALKLCLSP